MERLKKHKKLLLVLLLLLLFAVMGAAWYMQPDPQLAKVKSLQQKLFAKDREEISKEARKERFQQFRHEVSKLSKSQKEQFFKEMQKQFMKKFENKLDNFFALPPDQRTAALDADIDREEARRRQWQQWQKNRKDRDGSPGNGKRRGPGNGRRGGKPRNAEERERRGRNFLDGTSPKFRAQFTEYRRLMNERRKARGLPPYKRGRRR